MATELIGQRFNVTHAAGVTRYQVDRPHRDVGYFECVAIRGVSGTHHFVGGIQIMSEADIRKALDAEPDPYDARESFSRINRTREPRIQINMHTPGPWTVEPSDSGDASVGMAATPPVVFTTIPNRDDRYVEIAIIGSTIYDNSEEGDDLAYGDPDANACLIAAAPDLLAALRLTVETFGPWHDKGCPCDDTCDCSAKPVHDVINTAIRKAEGAA